MTCGWKEPGSGAHGADMQVWQEEPGQACGTVPLSAQDTQRPSSVHQCQMDLPVVGGYMILTNPGLSQAKATSFPDAPYLLFLF